MIINIKKLFTIIPNEFAEGSYILTKYENGEFVKSYDIFEDEIMYIRRKVEKEGYIFAKDIDFLEEEITRYQYIINDLKSQIEEAIASGDYIREN